MKLTAKRLIIINALIISAIIALFFVTHLLKEHEIECIIASNFHMYCPGCGGTRSAWALLNFDIISSVKYNISVPLLCLMYFYYNVVLITAIIKNKKEYAFTKRDNLIMYIFLGVVILNFILKNFLLWGFDIDLLGNFTSNCL